MSGDEERPRWASGMASPPGLEMPSPRRPKGSGGVFPVREGVWRVDIERARDPVTGRRRRTSRTIEGTRQDAELALARLKVAGHERRLPASGTSARSVRAALEAYLATVEAGTTVLAPRTLLTSRAAANTMSSTVLASGRTFGAIRLSQLTWQDVDELYAAMKADGKSSDWVRRCATVLSRAFELARKRGLLDSNPVKDATRPRSTRSKLARAAVLLAATGARKAELLGLQWADIDWSNAEVHVAAAISDGGPGVGVIRKSTKRSDWRDVPLTAQALAALETQAARHREVYAREPSKSEYVFAAVGRPDVPQRPDTFSDRWAAARGTSRVTLAQLRHFAATMMLDAGESYRTVADILGNSENTLRLHYDGRTDVGKRRAVAALEL
jgi:integrase